MTDEPDTDDPEADEPTAGGAPTDAEPGGDPEAEPAAPPAEAPPAEPAESDDGSDLLWYLSVVALGALVVLAGMGLFGLYTSATRVIDVWVAREYQPVFRALFNLVVLLAAAAGVARLLPTVRALR